MTIPAYAVYLKDPANTGLRVLPPVECIAALAANSVSFLDVKIPYSATTWQMANRRDARLYLWRNGRLVGRKVFFVRRARITRDAQGVKLIALRGLCCNTLLERRIVAYPAGSAEAQKSGLADDLIKEIADENFGSGAAAARQWDVTIIADRGAGPTIDIAAAWRRLLDASQSIAGKSWEDGTPLYFDVYTDPTGALFLDTFAGQRGVDRSSGKQPLVLRDDSASVEYAELVHNYDGEASYVYVGGGGQEEERLIEEVEDTYLSGLSPYGRIEAFADYANIDAAATLQDKGGEWLERLASRPQVVLRLRDTPQLQYGLHWDWGDRVGYDVFGERGTAVIERLRLTLRDGQERIEPTLVVTDV